MDRENKNRSGSQSNRGGSKNGDGESKQTSQPGAPNKSNRQTKGDDERGPVKRGGEKKGPNAV